MNVKSGLQSTEFWGKVAVQVLALVLMVLHQVDASWAVGAIAVLEAIYTVLRSVLKAQAATAQAGPLTEVDGLSIPKN